MTKVLFCVWMFLAACVNAQNLDSLKSNSQKVYNATITKDFEQVLEYTYPKLFDILPKQDMLIIMQSMFENPRFQLNIADTPPNFTFDKIVEHDNGYYSMVYHDLSFEMKLSQPTENPDELIDVLVNIFDAKSASYDKQSQTFTILKRSCMIAIANEHTNFEWNFLNKDKNNVDLMAQILSEPVLAALGM